MRIRSKAILILTAAVAAISLGLVVISLTVLRAGYLALEERHALRSLVRVRMALAQRLSSLGRTARDWSRWDETWRFIQGENPGFPGENLEEESLETLDADLMLFLGRDGRLVHERRSGRDGQAPDPAATGTLRTLFAGAPLPPSDASTHVVTGVAPVAGAPLLCASHPVFHSDGSGPSAGHLVICRLLDGRRLAELSAEVGLPLALGPPGALPPGATEAVLRPGGDRLLALGLFADPSGAPAFTVEVGDSRELYARGMATIRTFLLVIMGVGLVVGALSLLALHRGVLSRLESLDAQVRRIGSGGAGGRAVAMGGSDELSDLAASINAMLHSLAQADAALARSERLAALGTLAGGAAHQFNNINAGVLAAAEVALGTPGLDARVRDHLERIARGAMRSAAVTRGLLAFSGEIQQTSVPGRLDEVVADALPVLAPEIERHAITLETRLAEVPEVRMDPGLVQQAVLNLVLNAVHAVAGRPERRIEVETGADEAHVRLSVRDTGCGIPAGDLPQIFTPFFTTKGEHARRGSPLAQFSGSGLGLSVSHTIAVRHGGRIGVESVEGAGSVFTLLLPRGGPAPAAP